MISSRDAKPATCGGELVVADRRSARRTRARAWSGPRSRASRRDEVLGVERETVLVLLGRRADDAEAEEAHFFLRQDVSSAPLFPAALACLSARFSLMDLPDFLVMPCRGDLSLIGAPWSEAWMAPSGHSTPRATVARVDDPRLSADAALAADLVREAALLAARIRRRRPRHRRDKTQRLRHRHAGRHGRRAADRRAARRRAPRRRDPGGGGRRAARHVGAHLGDRPGRRHLQLLPRQRLVVQRDRARRRGRRAPRRGAPRRLAARRGSAGPTCRAPATAPRSSRCRRPRARRGAPSTYLHPPFYGSEVGEAFARALGQVGTLRMLGSGTMDVMAIASGQWDVLFQHTVRRLGPAARAPRSSAAPAASPSSYPPPGSTGPSPGRPPRWRTSAPRCSTGSLRPCSTGSSSSGRASCSRPSSTSSSGSASAPTW